jgi:ABC-type polysaccharide/polyol phosphate export permease
MSLLLRSFQSLIKKSLSSLNSYLDPNPILKRSKINSILNYNPVKHCLQSLNSVFTTYNKKSRAYLHYLSASLLGFSVGFTVYHLQSLQALL